MTSKTRSKLNSIAMTCQDLVFIGKEGLSDTVIEQIDNNLYSHELVKIKVQNNCDMELKDLANNINEKLDCETVSIIGRKIVIYKLSDKDKIHHIL